LSYEEKGVPPSRKEGRQYVSKPDKEGRRETFKDRRIMTYTRTGKVKKSLPIRKKRKGGVAKPTRLAKGKLAGKKKEPDGPSTTQRREKNSTCHIKKQGTLDANP